MTRFHTTSEGNTPFTLEEEIQRDIEEAAHAANISKDVIKQQIATLESSITQRRLREAIRGNGKAWLDAIDDQIAILRTQL